MVDIIDMAVDFLVLVIFAVVGFAIFYATNTSGWSTTVIAIWGLLPVAFIGIGILTLIVKVKYIKK
jgi:hypothetical protein